MSLTGEENVALLILDWDVLVVIEEFGDERVSKLSGGLLGVGLGEMEAQTLKESREQRWCLIYLELWTRKSLTSVNSRLNRAEKIVALASCFVAKPAQRRIFNCKIKFVLDVSSRYVSIKYRQWIKRTHDSMALYEFRRNSLKAPFQTA